MLGTYAKCISLKTSLLLLSNEITVILIIGCNDNARDRMGEMAAISKFNALL